MCSQFFDESREQSEIKSRIVSKYFWAWAKVIIPTAKKTDNRIAYMDLFAGPGRFKDGTMSTPLLILQRAIADADMRNMLVSVFNDKDGQNAESLAMEIKSLEGVNKLRYEPKVYKVEVGTEIVQMFSEMKLVPTFFFVDPWGYKGLSLQLVNAILKDWGCDCVFFFNYNRINMGLNNEIVRQHMNAIFGSERAGFIRSRLEELEPSDRESLIVEELSQALKEMGATFVLPFTFRNEAGSRTSHHLIFASKNFKGYEIMKEIMATESSEHTQGVPSFEYSPSSKMFPLLFELTRPLDDLEESILSDFQGKTVSMQDVYMQHNFGKRYIKSNYKKALVNLEGKGLISVDPPANQRKKWKGQSTFANQVKITFPRRNER